MIRLQVGLFAPCFKKTIPSPSFFLKYPSKMPSGSISSSFLLQGHTKIFKPFGRKIAARA